MIRPRGIVSNINYLQSQKFLINTNILNNLDKLGYSFNNCDDYNKFVIRLAEGFSNISFDIPLYIDWSPTWSPVEFILLHIFYLTKVMN